MTKIPSVEEVFAESIAMRIVHSEAGHFEPVYHDELERITQYRLALLTELREYVDRIAYHDDWDCHVLDYGKIKAHLDELIKSNSI